MRLGLLTGFALIDVAFVLSLIDPGAGWAALGIIGGFVVLFWSAVGSQHG